MEYTPVRDHTMLILSTCCCPADRLKKMAIKQNSGSTGNTAAAGTAAAAVAAAKPAGRVAARAAARAAASQLSDGSDEDSSEFDLEVWWLSEKGG